MLVKICPTRGFIQATLAFAMMSAIPAFAATCMGHFLELAKHLNLAELRRPPDPDRPKFAFFPFGGGPRICIGNHFAMLESVLVLATIGQRFRFTIQSGPPVVPYPTITLKPSPGIPAVLESR
jgi:hypothetical protein